ncbi:MAG: hypothetical protein ACR2QT_09365 [Woeseiaceae bacterium]
MLQEDRLNLRAPDIVMDLERLGRLYPYRLSFMRVLVRRMMHEQWKIERVIFELNHDGYGHAVYEIRTRQNLYSLVIFSQQLDAKNRSDRVIAEKWDMTATLCEGVVDDERLAFFRDSVPLQEKGRLDASCFVLSRANKSERNFEYVVNALASGEQPSLQTMSRVGYLYRTTAVYGSGKFGMADWQKVRERYTDFARPFAAEMFMCFMIRQFSLEQADYLAAQRAPDTAVPMSDEIKRFVGIGNATGLGMAPYLINHPLLISRWIEVRETALARVLETTTPNAEKLDQLLCVARKSIRHLQEIETDNEPQDKINKTTIKGATSVVDWLSEERSSIRNWSEVTDYAVDNASMETQELLNTLLMEIHAEVVDDLEDSMVLSEDYALHPEMPASTLSEVIEQNYDWALAIDFSEASEHGAFWYRSEEKMEPRLGVRGTDAGSDREMFIGIAYAVRNCYDALCDALTDDPELSVADFVIASPSNRQIVRRVQTMAATTYGDIRANLVNADVKPIHLLRCKLSFFGVSKFDPRSRLWVRNTMFQGAPVRGDIGEPFLDDWCFPTIPGVQDSDLGQGH